MRVSNQELSAHLARIFSGTTTELERQRTERIRRCFYIAGILCFIVLSIVIPIHMMRLYAHLEQDLSVQTEIAKMIRCNLEKTAGQTSAAPYDHPYVAP